MSEVRSVTDATGRKIDFRDMSIVDQVKVVRMLGRSNPADAQNAVLTQIAMLACSVTHIDGAPRPDIQRPEDIDAAIARLGDEGFAALQVEAERRRKELESAAAEAAEQAAKELAKNSAATPASSTPAG